MQKEFSVSVTTRYFYLFLSVSKINKGKRTKGWGDNKSCDNKDPQINENYKKTNWESGDFCDITLIFTPYAYLWVYMHLDFLLLPVYKCFSLLPQH